MLIELTAGHVITVVLPVVQSHRTVNLEQCRRICLRHLRCQLLLIGSGCSGHHLDFCAGLLGVLLGQILPGLLCLRLEVQIVDLTVAGFALRCIGSTIRA